MRCHIHSGTAYLFSSGATSNGIWLNSLAFPSWTQRPPKVSRAQTVSNPKSMFTDNMRGLGGYANPSLGRPKHIEIKARYRLRISGQSKIIAKACKKVAEKLKKQTGRTRIPTATPGQWKPKWVEKLIGKPAAISVLRALWMEENAEHRKQHGSRKKLKKIR